MPSIIRSLIAFAVVTVGVPIHAENDAARDRARGERATEHRSELAPDATRGSRRRPVQPPVNLLKNFTFVQPLDDWKFDDRYPQGEGSTEWSTVDVNDGVSGSALLRVTQPGRARQILQCVAVTPGTLYDVRASTRLVNATAPGSALLAFIEYPSSDCTGAFVTYAGITEYPGPVGRWAELRGTVRPGSRTRSIQLILGVYTLIPGELSAHFDDVAVFSD